MFHEDNINSEDKCSGTENILPLSKELGLFYLKVRKFYVLPVKIAENIMGDVVKLLNLFRNEMEAAVQSTIDRQKISDFESVWNEIKKDSCFREFCKSLNLVEPETIKLLKNQVLGVCTSLSNCGHRYTSFQYIPILKTLICYLSHWNVLYSI